MLPGACKGLKVQQNRQNKAQKEANLQVIIENQEIFITNLSSSRSQLM